jgi:hypothetical protein
MVISYRFNPKYSVIIAQVDKSLSYKNLLGYLASVAGDPSIPSDHVTLFDASNVEELAITSRELEELVSVAKSLYSDRAAKKIAIIARGDKEFEIAEQYEHLASAFGESALVFFNYDVACKWLGVPGDA